MPRINSANPDFDLLQVPSDKPIYTHGLEKRQSFIPVAFQITSPYNNRRCLLPHALVMHVNPQTWSESHNQKIERIQTRGGFVEQHWGTELTEVNADGSTGAFMNIYTGLSSVLRHRTIAWDRFRDLYDLYRNNGSVYDPFGNIVLQGNVMLMYDRGTYIGYFNKFDVEETDDQPFAFKVSWSFKVQEEIMKLPGLAQDPSQRGKFPIAPAPTFQSQNKAPTQSTSTTEALSANQQIAADALSKSASIQAQKAGLPNTGGGDTANGPGF